jgi:hypothetical protein
MVCKILSPWSDERAGTPKSVAQIAVAHFSILQSPYERRGGRLIPAVNPDPVRAESPTEYRCDGCIV